MTQKQVQRNSMNFGNNSIKCCHKLPLVEISKTKTYEDLIMIFNKEVQKLIILFKSWKIE